MKSYNENITIYIFSLISGGAIESTLFNSEVMRRQFDFRNTFLNQSCEISINIY